MVGIYKITSPSSKVYIGQSFNIKRRWSVYRGMRFYKCKLYSSFLKWGVKNHIFEMVHELPIDVSRDVMNNYECFYMEQYKNCEVELLNLKGGGSKGRYSKESREKMSKSQKMIVKKPHTDQAKKNMSIAQSGRIVTDESKEKMRLAWIERRKNPDSEVTRKRKSESTKKRKRDDNGRFAK